MFCLPFTEVVIGVGQREGGLPRGGEAWRGFGVARGGQL